MRRKNFDPRMSNPGWLIRLKLIDVRDAYDVFSEFHIDLVQLNLARREKGARITQLGRLRSSSHCAI